MLDRVRKLNIRGHAAEIVFFLFKMGESLLEPSLGLYIYQCICLDYDRTTSDAGQACSNLTYYPEHERQVQQDAANYLIAHKVLLNFPAIIVGLFCGAWSDVIGRRIPVFLTLAASLIGVIMYLTSLVPSGSTGQQSALVLILIGAAVRGCVGKSAVITLALYSYVCDVAPRAQRTQKIGRLMSMNYFGFFVGSMTAGGLLEFHGFYVIFSAVLVLQISCFVVAVFFLKTTDEITAERLEAEGASHAIEATVCPSGETAGEVGGGVVHRSTVASSTTGEDGKHNRRLVVGNEKRIAAIEDTSLKPPMSRFPFRPSYVRDSIAVLARQRTNNDRLHVVALFLTLFFIQTCRAGELEATLLFAERSPLSWKRSMYGYLLATDYASLGVSTLVILPFLIRCFHLADMTMILIGVGFRIIRIMLLAGSTTTLGIYFSVVVGAPSALIMSCGKALISKTIHTSELGKAFALISSAEPVSSLVGSVIFNSIYRATFDSLFPGFVFALEGACLICLFIALTVLWYDFKQPATADAQFGSLPEETQLRTPTVATQLGVVTAAVVGGDEAKAASRSGQTLTEVMNAWPQQHYGAAVDSAKTRLRDGGHLVGDNLHSTESDGSRVHRSQTNGGCGDVRRNQVWLE